VILTGSKFGGRYVLFESTYRKKKSSPLMAVVTDSNRDKTQGLRPGIFRKGTSDEADRFEAARAASDALFAESGARPSRLEGAPASLVRQDAGTIAELDAAAVRIFWALDRSGVRPKSGGARAADGHLLPLSPVRTILLLDESLVLASILRVADEADPLDTIRSRHFYRDRSDADRYGATSLSGAAPTVLLGALGGLTAEWGALPPKYHDPDVLTSENERYHRALKAAQDDAKARVVRRQSSSQKDMDLYVWTPLGPVQRLNADNKLVEYHRVSPGRFLPTMRVELYSQDETNRFLTESIESALGGKAAILSMAPVLLDQFFGYDAVTNMAKCGYFDSAILEGSTDAGRAARIGTNSDRKLRELIDIYVWSSVDAYDDESRQFDFAPRNEDAADAAWREIGSKICVFADAGLVSFDYERRSWFCAGRFWQALDVHLEARAREYDALAATATSSDQFGYRTQASHWRSVLSRPTLSTVMVCLQTRFLYHGGQPAFNIYCEYGVRGVARAKGGEDLRAVTMEMRREYIQRRNAGLTPYRNGVLGLQSVYMQARGPHAALDVEDRFYTSPMNVGAIPSWAFGEGGAKRVLNDEYPPLLAFINAAAARVPGPSHPRPTVNNVRNFLSLKPESSAVLFGCDVRYCFDGDACFEDGATWIQTAAPWPRVVPRPN